MNLLNFTGEIEIVLRQPAGAMRAQIHGNLVVGVGPARVMVHLFGGDRDSRHKSECRGKILELENAVQVSIHHGPAAEFSQFRSNFVL